MTDKIGQGLRIDRWLWYARFYRTRSLAAAAIKSGHVRIDDQRAKPGSQVVPGNRVQLVRDQLVYDVVVQTLPQRRGPADDARQSYHESEESQRAREARIEVIRQDRRLMPRTDGRPDKYTRRKVRQFIRRQGDE